MATSKQPRPDAPLAIDPNSRATVSGPAEPQPLVDSSDDLTTKMAATQQLDAALPFEDLQTRRRLFDRLQATWTSAHLTRTNAR